MDRREFLKDAIGAGAAAIAAGCAGRRFRLTEGGFMDGFSVKPMERIRVGVIGVGNRGSYGAQRLATVPGVELTAICDLRAERLARTQEMVRKLGKPTPREYTGPEGWRRLCGADDIDVVYVVTDWEHHCEMCVYAMECGKHAFTEVPCATTVEGCWELVETAERTRRHCMMLENCNYGDTELMMYNMAHAGVFGELTHAECAYIHDLRAHCYKEPDAGGYYGDWRLRFNAAHKGNGYPTHGFGPVCWYMDVNRGDALDYLVSLESQQANFEHYAREALGGAAAAWKKDLRIQMGDMNTTLVKTAKGRSIMIQHDVSTPRPYARLNFLQGTKGAFWGMPWRNGDDDQWRIALERTCGEGCHGWRTREQAKDIEEKYRHQMWREAGTLAKLAGGHGGKDYMMDLRWAYCLQNGLPLDISVYDSATWSCIRELSELSVRAGSAPQKVPDFTRGGWRSARPLGDMKIDFAKLRLTPELRRLVERQEKGFVI